MKVPINFLLIAITLLKTYYSQGLNYTSNVLNNWACSTGRRQSPLALNSTNSTYTNNFSLVYENYLAFENVVLTFSEGLLQIGDKQNLLAGTTNKGYVVFDYGGYYLKFNLEKIVVHVPSEHKIDGYFPDIEVQYYHRKDLDYVSTVNKYKTLPDISESLVISTFYSVNGTHSDSGLLESLTNFYFASGVTINSFGVPLNIIPEGIIRDKKFYFYKGSDTMYPCNENHLRYVISDVYGISQAAVQFYQNAYQSRYIGNKFAKPLADFNGRVIYRNFYANSTEFNSSSWIKLNAFLISLIALIFFS